MEATKDATPEQNPPAAGGDGLEVQTKSAVITMGPPSTTVKKVIVAVHGVGDQYNFATIQSVVNQFCGFYDHPAAIPLGSFHTGQKAFSIPPPYPQKPFERFGFAEVYWATIPRKMVEEKYTLEETKQWARTIVERLRLRWRVEGKKGNCREEDFLLTQQVLTEMIQTVAVLDRICYLADKAGVFTFDLRKLLDHYLGDVQVVAEFKNQRDEILDTFAGLMKAVHELFPKAEIYIVAHSEGTVVSFLGLLEGFRNPQPPDWAHQVRGLMTLGSPIDKHLVLWPELFDKKPPAPALKNPEKKIEWRNYYDHGDPIGFELEDAREWLQESGWDGVFNFTDDHDIGFTRYPFPGKAHVDYWTDKEVFGHFISTVVDPPEDPGARHKKPQDMLRNQGFSYVVPYLGVAALLFIAAYVLCKAVNVAVGLDVPMLTLSRDVAGVAVLLLGITVVARIPHLTRSWFWRTIAFLIGGLSAAAYLWAERGEEPTPLLGYSVPAGGMTLALAAIVLVLNYIRPSWGLKPLMILGTAAAAIRVAYELQAARSDGSLWPVFLALVAFLYLWWLAALVFDLVFVWHLYIRHSKMLQRMNEITGGPRRSVPADEASLATA